MDKKNDDFNIDDLEIEQLSDEDLEEVAGGLCSITGKGCSPKQIEGDGSVE